ncbi:MAG: DUF4304 domain-containing protein [Proteobacteria bacterium]|nr:MAG: DUF4304 domain-containing protein [Pseudomonadota bacterium]
MTPFDKSLRDVVKPYLENQGYSFNGKRDFSAIVNGQNSVITFQKGLRGLAGTFTVNLSVEEKTERLGTIRINSWSIFINKFFGDKESLLKAVFLPKDKWWKISENQINMNKTMNDVVKMISDHGLNWIEHNTKS